MVSKSSSRLGNQYAKLGLMMVTLRTLMHTQMNNSKTLSIVRLALDR
jgi:hypothetical protein